MNKRMVLRVSGVISIFIGIVMLLNGFSGMTGFVIIEEFNGAFGSILGLVFLIGGISIMTSSNISLEKIVSNIGDIEKSRARAVELYTLSYMQKLEQERKIPREIINPKDKFDYARRELIRNSDPIVVYDSDNSIEYIKHFGSSPGRDRVPMAGDEGRMMPIRINYAITQPAAIKLTEKYSADNHLWSAARNKLYRFSSGEGVDMKYLKGTSVVYLRDISSGARVFLHKKSEVEYDLIGITSGQQKKADEDKMIKIFERLYGTK